MLYIFLDVDGVLNDTNTCNRIGGFIGVEDNKIRVLSEILKLCEGHSRLILSSSWRYHWNDESDHLNKYLRSRLEEFNIYIDDITPRLNGFSRGLEILTYLIETANFKSYKDNFIILDDEMFDYDYCSISDRLIKTNFYKSGLRLPDVIKARILLNTPPKNLSIFDNFEEFRDNYGDYLDVVKYNEHEGIEL